MATVQITPTRKQEDNKRSDLFIMKFCFYNVIIITWVQDKKLEERAFELFYRFYIQKAIATD
jgi:hypothetical protein